MGTNGYVGNYDALTGSWAFRMGGSGDYLSEKAKEHLNDEMHKIMKECIEDVESLLRREDALVERFTEELLKKDELDYDEIEPIFVVFGKQRLIPAPPAA